MTEDRETIPFYDLPWPQRLDFIVQTMREMSSQIDPQEMVETYGRRVRYMSPADRRISISRRNLKPPEYRITRSDTWDGPVNPWKNRSALPLMTGGLLAELIYAEQPRIIHDLKVSPDDPAAEYLAGMSSLQAIPQFDRGKSLNMVISMHRAKNAFDPQRLPELVLTANLFGRATHNLVLSEEVKRAYEAVDHELAVVADIQRSLLPVQLPQIPTLETAAHYQTSQRPAEIITIFFRYRMAAGAFSSPTFPATARPPPC